MLKGSRCETDAREVSLDFRDQRATSAGPVQNYTSRSCCSNAILCCFFNFRLCRISLPPAGDLSLILGRMANTFVASRIQLIYALCLPLAVLLGYFLADPADPSSILIVFMVVALLSLPLLMTWHHPLLVFSWNAAVAPYFLPGQPFLWMLLAFLALGFAVVNRFTNQELRFIKVPSITKPLILLFVVVVVTAWIRGGVGLRSLGSETYGSKGYMYVVAAIAGYFALTSQRLPLHKARFYVGLFFLAGLTALVPNLAYIGGKSLEFLFYIFPAAWAIEQAAGDYALNALIVRIFGLTLASSAIYCWLMASYGLRGTFDLSKPWRLVAFLVAMTACLFCGFRSFMVLFLFTVAAQFCLEGLFRARIVMSLVGTTLVGGALLIPNADKLPLVVQRTLSFLPIEVSPIARITAETSTDWRLEMWQEVIPLLPRYALLGKGYALNPTDLAFAAEADRRGFGHNYNSSLAAGDYHNGLLTLVVPLGIWGVIGFGWFLVAAFKYLYRNYREGDPSLRGINTFLLAYLIAHTLQFFLVFGSFYSDLFMFTGIVGLSVSVNGAEAFQPAEAEVEAEAPNLAYAGRWRGEG
jgi:hypothetical protein